MTKTGKIIVWIIVIALVIWAASAMQKGKSNGLAKIGFVAGLTGSYAPYGEMMKKGADLAIKDLQSQGRAFELVAADTQSDVKTGIAAYQSVKDSVSAFISGQSGVVLAIAPLANQDKKVLLNTSALNPAIRTAGDYVFSNINDASVEVAAMTDYLYKKGLRKMAIIYQNDSSGTAAKDVFSESWKKLGGTITAEESFVDKATDVRSQLGKIGSTKPEGVYVPAFPENVGLILKQASDLGISTKWFSWNVEGADLVKIAGPSAEGIVYSSTTFDPASDGNDLTVKNFVSEFQAAYGTFPNIYAATAYDGIMLVATAMGRVGSEGSSIQNYLSHVSDYRGVSGNTTFDSDGMVKKEVIFKTVKDGSFVKLN